MATADLARIRSEVSRRALTIGASGYVLPTYGQSEDAARPHIEADSRGYHYVVVERGQELKRVTTQDWMTFSMQSLRALRLALRATTN